jgi:lipopolysaccharide transport system permease protein
MYFLAWRDVKVRYKQASLGAAWAIIQPLFAMVTFTFFFGKLAGISSSGVPYPLFSFSALVLWMYFSVTLGQAGNSLINNSSLITKVYFPRLLLPASSAFGGLIDLGVSSLFLAGMMWYYHVAVSWTVIFAPLFVLEVVVLVMGASMFLGAVNVKYRDVKHTIPFLVQIGLFVTPIIYPVTFIPESHRWLLKLNPLTGIIEGFRASLFGGNMIDWQLTGVSWVITLAVFALGYIYFRKTEQQFADIV